MNTGRNNKQTTCLCRDTGGKGTLPAQHTTFNTLDNWAIKTPPNQKGKGPERKGYRVMARNMYTIHSVTFNSCTSSKKGLAILMNNNFEFTFVKLVTDDKGDFMLLQLKIND